MSLIFEGEFAIGDWVSINGFKGEVLPSNLRITKLRSATGEVKMISNRTITEVTNYSMYNTNLMLDIDVAYESDISKVKDVLDKLCEKFKTEYELKDVKCDGIQELASSSIKFRVTVTCKFLEQFQIGRFLKKEIVTHSITLVPGSKLQSILETDTILVNSRHSYHVPDSGLKSVGAYADDGIIEALEEDTRCK